MDRWHIVLLIVAAASLLCALKTHTLRVVACTALGIVGGLAVLVVGVVDWLLAKLDGRR